MTDPDGTAAGATEPDLTAARALAEQWREARRALIALAERLPESRISRATERAGWTLKHELASLASMDHEAGQLLLYAREHGFVQLDAPVIRRLRGEAMHAAQELRLAPLREHLVEAGERTARMIEDAGDLLTASVTVAGREAPTLRDHLRAGLERARASIDVVARYLD